MTPLPKMGVYPATTFFLCRIYCKTVIAFMASWHDFTFVVFKGARQYRTVQRISKARFFVLPLCPPDRLTQLVIFLCKLLHPPLQSGKFLRTQFPDDLCTDLI